MTGDPCPQRGAREGGVLAAALSGRLAWIPILKCFWAPHLSFVDGRRRPGFYSERGLGLVQW